MKLVQAKTRGLGAVIETQWIELSPHLNLFHFSEVEKGYRFLQTLQTINPPFSCKQLDPFADFPEFITWRGYQRRVIESKRTVALGVFGATPELVTELAALTPLLFETDRIEVGRRLDYSRWSNFVELASSTRWSEVTSEMSTLLSTIKGSDPEIYSNLCNLTDTLKASDRIKGAIGESLLAIFTELEQTLGADCPPEVAELKEKSMRYQQFHDARDIVYKRLPLLLTILSDGSLAELPEWSVSANRGAHLNPEDIHAESQEISEDHDQNPLQRIRGAIEKSREISKAQSSTEPILLLHCPEKNIPPSNRSALLELIKATASDTQCLLVTDDSTLLKQCPAGKVYYEKDFTLGSPPGRDTASNFEE